MIAITGATGHTGSRAAEALLAKGEKVRAIGRDRQRLEPLWYRRRSIRRKRERCGVHDHSLRRRDCRLSVLPEDMSSQDLRAHQELVSDSSPPPSRSAACHTSLISAASARNTRKRPGPSSGLHNLEQKLNRNRGPQRPAPARRLFYGKSSDEHSADALDGNSSRAV